MREKPRVVAVAQRRRLHPINRTLAVPFSSSATIRPDFGTDADQSPATASPGRNGVPNLELKKGEPEMRRNNLDPPVWHFIAVEPEANRAFRRVNVIIISILTFLILGIFIATIVPPT